jgi:hypothetical protein
MYRYRIRGVGGGFDPDEKELSERCPPKGVTN